MTEEEFIAMLADFVDDEKAKILYQRIDPDIFTLEPASDEFLTRLDAELDRILAEEGVQYEDEVKIQEVTTVEVLDD